MITWIFPTAVAATALTLSAYQEFRHRTEGNAKLQVDVRTMWRRRNTNDLADLIVLELLAFNPAMKGLAISHVRVELEDRSDVSLDLARPKKVGVEWELEPFGSTNVLKVSGDFDMPYTIPPVSLAARQGGSAILAFIPNEPIRNLEPGKLRVYCRVGSFRTNREGLLGWRKRLHRELPLFDEVEARWLEAGFDFAGTRLSPG